MDKLAAEVFMGKKEAAGVRCRVIKGVKRAICFNIKCVFSLF